MREGRARLGTYGIRSLSRLGPCFGGALEREADGYKGISVEAVRAPYHHLPWKSELVAMALGMLSSLAFSFSWWA